MERESAAGEVAVTVGAAEEPMLPESERVFVRASEWLVDRTTARTRRALNFWLFLVWLVPGTVVWLVLRHALWFVGFMSLYAIWVTHWSGFAAETPVEGEGDA